MATGQAKTKGKQGQWIKEAKAKADAMDALFREHGVSSVEELNAKLAAHAPVAPKSSGKTTNDPLGWITKTTPYVSLVSSTSLFVLRRKRTDVAPHVTRIALKARTSGPWAGCPFFIGDRSNHVHDNNVKTYKESWWKHQLTKQMAEAVYADPRAGIETPSTAVVDPAKFGGWDGYARQARGEHDALDEFVPLREVVRRLLQKSNDTFLDWIARPKGHEFDRRVVNPYRNKISDVVKEFATDRFG